MQLGIAVVLSVFFLCGMGPIDECHGTVEGAEANIVDSVSTSHGGRDNLSRKKRGWGFIGGLVGGFLLSRRRRSPPPPPSCSSPPNIHVGGSVSYSSTSHNSKATYTCHQGFNLIGSSQLTCQDGGWTRSGSSPYCSDINECSQSGSHPPHSTCTNTVGSYFWQCYDGHQESRDRRLCEPRGCSSPPSIEHGTFAVTHIAHGGNVTYKCNGGYKMQGALVRTCSLGRWSGTPTSCTEIDECEFTPCDHVCQNTPGSFLCSCNPGYELESDDRSCRAHCPKGCENGGTCTSDGCQCPEGFTGDECEIRSCRDIPPPGHGLVSCFTFNKQRVCNLFCKDNYTFADDPGNPYACGEDGRWSHERNGVPIPDCSELDSWEIRAGLGTDFVFHGTCESLTDSVLKAIYQKSVEKAATLVGCAKGGQCEDATLSAQDISCGEGARRRRSAVGVQEEATTDIIFGIEAEGDKSIFVEKYCGQQCRSKIRQYVSAVYKVVGQLESRLNSDSITSIEAGNLTLTYLRDSSRRSKLAFHCPKPGQVRKGTKCMSCPPGTYFSRNKCPWCPHGTYQSNEGQTRCIRCPLGKTTDMKGARRLSDCN